MKHGIINCRYCGGLRPARSDFCMGCGSPAAIAQQTRHTRKIRCPKCTDGVISRNECTHKYLCQSCGFDSFTVTGTECGKIATSDHRPKRRGGYWVR